MSRNGSVRKIDMDPITVDVGESLGDRELTDAACGNEHAAATRICETSARGPADGS